MSAAVTPLYTDRVCPACRGLHNDRCPYSVAGIRWMRLEADETVVHAADPWHPTLCGRGGTARRTDNPVGSPVCGRCAERLRRRRR